MAFVMPCNGLAISLRRCGPSSGQRCTSRRLTIRAAVTVPAEFKTVAPVGDRVFVKVDANEETSIGGILLPTSAQKKPTKGEVVGMGSAKALKAGDKVVYSKYAGTDLKLGGAEHVILKEDDVIGILAGDNIADLKPLGDRVLIEVAEGEDQTAGGVLLTAASKEKPTMGKVIAVGSGKENDKGEVVAPNLKAGDMVLYSKYSGTEFTGSNDTQYIVVRESDILASVA